MSKASWLPAHVYGNGYVGIGSKGICSWVIADTREILLLYTILFAHVPPLHFEIVGLLNRLLEKLHQADGNNQGSIVLNIYGKGSLHVDHVDNQYLYGDKWVKPQKEKGTYDASAMPASLCSEQAMILWKKAQDAGYVDANYQPLISRTQAALLADAMAERLGIKEKWKVFEGLWNRKNMRGDYTRAMNQQQSLSFQDKLKRLFSTDNEETVAKYKIIG